MAVLSENALIQCLNNLTPCCESKLGEIEQNETVFYRDVVNMTHVARIVSEVPEPPLYILVLATIFYVLIFLIGIIGNILVMIVVIYSRTMKTHVNLYLLNLCVADILVLVVCMPTALVELHTKEVWHFGEAMCKAVPFLEIVVAGASVFTIMAVTIERYLMLYHPATWKKINPGQVLKILMMIWTFSMGIGSPILLIVRFKDSTFLDGTPVKVCRLPIQKNWQKFYIILMTMVIYVIPCVILFVLYSHVCRALLPSYKTPSDMQEVSCVEKKKLRRQVVNIIVTIVIVFFICHLPYRVVSIWLIFETKMMMEKLGLEIYLNILYSARILLYINHALNPILYNIVSNKFRTKLWWLCYEKCTTKNDEQSTTINKHIYLHENTKLKTKSVSFRYPNASPLVCNPPEGGEAMRPSSSSIHKINDFSFIYTKLDQDHIRRVATEDNSNSHIENSSSDMVGGQMGSLQLTLDNGCYIKIKVPKNKNRGSIIHHTT